MLDQWASQKDITSGKNRRSYSSKEVSQWWCAPGVQTRAGLLGKDWCHCFRGWLGWEAATQTHCKPLLCSFPAYRISLGVLSCPPWPALTPASLHCITTSWRQARQGKIKACPNRLGRREEGWERNGINHLNLQTKQKTHSSAAVWTSYHKNNKSKKHYLYANSWAIHWSQGTPGLLPRITAGNAAESSSKADLTPVITRILLCSFPYAPITPIIPQDLHGMKLTEAQNQRWSKRC